MKKSFMFVLMVLFIVIFILWFNKNKNDSVNKLSNNNEVLIDDILKYDLLEDKINKEFLVWIGKNYKVLSKLKNNLKGDTYSLTTWYELTGNSLLVLLDKHQNKFESSQLTKNNDINFIGDVSLADNFEIMPYYDSRGGISGILSEEIIHIMKKDAVTVANNEFAISDRGTPLKNKYYTFKADTERTAIYDEMGVELVTLANNHVYDYGEEAFLDTLDTLDKYDIKRIGAGRNIAEASKPYYYVVNGYKVAFVNSTRAEKIILTKEATDTESGVLKSYNPQVFLKLIEDTKKDSDYVIALIHWGEEDSHQLESFQAKLAKEYMDAGADVLIGTHAHTLQGMEVYKNKLIAYNIGDFIFNKETKDTGILNIKIEKDGKLKYKFIPCLQKDMYTSILKGNGKSRVLNNIKGWSPNINFNEDGDIIY